MKLMQEISRHLSKAKDYWQVQKVAHAHVLPAIIQGCTPLIRLTEPNRSEDLEEDLATLFAQRKPVGDFPLGPYAVAEDEGPVDREETERNDDDEGDGDEEESDPDYVHKSDDDEEEMRPQKDAGATEDGQSFFSVFVGLSTCVTYICDKDTPWQARRSLQQALNTHSPILQS